MNFADVVKLELENARLKRSAISSAHEGYAIILEELEEFWEEVRKKKYERDEQNMLRELIQIAAMAQRTAEDLINKPGGNNGTRHNIQNQ